MINLEKYYGDLNEGKLVEIIESDSNYNPEVIEFCKNRITQMDLSKEVLKNLSREVFKKRFYKYFTTGKYRTNEEINIDSFFLNEKEVKLCFELSRNEYIKHLGAATHGLDLYT